MEVKEYRVKAYALLVKKGIRSIESLPSAYRVPVAEYIVKQEEEE